MGPHLYDSPASLENLPGWARDHVEPSKRISSLHWVHSLLFSLCVNHFSHSCDPVPDRTNLKRGGFVVGSQFFKGYEPTMARKTWRQNRVSRSGRVFSHVGEPQSTLGRGGDHRHLQGASTVTQF